MRLQTCNRRTAVKSSLFGLLAVSVPNVLFARSFEGDSPQENDPDKLFYRYPAIDDEVVSEVVGKSHFDFDRVKELVDQRPELARATWDWGFGDWETAIGAASHVGRRDIVLYLMEKGARPDIFTFATLGAYETVKAMVAAIPGVQSIAGPHGISLLQHAEAGLRMADTLTEAQKSSSEQLIRYLESLGNADSPQYETVKAEDQEQYLGDYKYGEGAEDGFSVRLNMRKLLSLGKIGTFGGALYKIGENRFMYNGTPSVEISFQFEKGKVVSLTVHEPDLMLKAKKV